jgi:hypothetical protein
MSPSWILRSSAKVVSIARATFSGFTPMRTAHGAATGLTPSVENT